MKEANRIDFARRTLLETGVATVLVGLLFRSAGWAGTPPHELDRWARQLIELNTSLSRKEITVTDWQSKVSALNQSVSVADIAAYLNLDQVTGGFTYASRLSDHNDPMFPPDIIAREHGGHWFIRVFGMRRGGAVIPHVHNNMVSAHLVVGGSFHARTHDRVKDLEGAVVLRPSIDKTLKVGDVISMSDQRDNQHWLVAEQDRSMTFDVGVVALPPSWPYGLKANENNMIFVDPDRAPERDGLIVAPVMTFEQCAAKYATGA